MKKDSFVNLSGSVKNPNCCEAIKIANEVKTGAYK